MKNRFQKLRSNRGSSMVMAMMLMLVAVMVSGTILAASVTAARNLARESDSQQAYLAVSSAAETFRDSVKDFDGKFRWTRKIKTPKGPGQQEVTIPESSTPVDTCPFEAQIDNVLLAATKSQSSPYIGEEQRYQISAEGLEDVYMTLTLVEGEKLGSDRQYTLTAVFSNMNGDTLPKYPCRMQVSFDATLTTDSRTNNEDVNYTWTEENIIWGIKNGAITRIKEAANETD